jgi:Fic family protein
MHRTLLKGVGGSSKQPGSYRSGHVWVGGRKDTLETAEFVPVPPFAIPHLMDNLIGYMNGDCDDPIRKIAVSHYQFETIHPFADGNGRIGRLLILLLLYKEGIMNNPFLYISEYFNRYRQEYLGSLMNVRRDGDLTGWTGFLLDALYSQTERSMELLDSLAAYRKMMKELALNERSGELDTVCGMLIENPFITVRDITGRTGVSAPTARKLIGILISKDILIAVEGRRKGMLYKAPAIMDMLESIWYGR